MKISPCKDCEERHTKCHSKCKKYHEYKIFNFEEKSALKRVKFLDYSPYNPYISGRKNRQF